MQQHDYVPRHAGPDTVSSRSRGGRRRRWRVKPALIVAAVLAGGVVVAVGAWLALSGGGDAGSLEAFCAAADTYFASSSTLPDDPQGVREFVDSRVRGAADLARQAPADVRATADAYASDVAAARKAFERHGYSPSLLNDALSATLDPPGDVAAVLRVMGYSYSGDAAGERAGQLVAYRDRHCHGEAGP
ncbi:MAG: hypothetical protein K1X95_08010 [Acidimicrobiia bacterium]|nr:hypothetical protein [Acidimicrobiia bacterium]